MRLTGHLLGLALLFAVGAPVGADVLCLQDGRIFEDVKVLRHGDTYIVYFEHGEVEVPADRVLDCIIDGEIGFVPTTDEEKERVAKGQVRFQGQWMSERKRDTLLEKMLAEQRASIDAMKDRRLWRNRLMEETKNFSWEATVPQHLFEEHRDLCEVYFKDFVKSWKIKRPKGMGPLTIKFYEDQENYMQVTGMSRNVLGFFRYVEPYELNIYYDRLDPLGTEEVMYHEVGHYLQQLIDVDFKYPHWPGESLSEYYSASSIDPKTKKEVSWGGIHEGRVLNIQRDIEEGKRVSVRQLILDGPQRTYHDYTWGWAFVHFLLSTPEYEKNFRKFFIALARGKGVERRLAPTGTHRLMTVTGEEMLAVFMKTMKLRSDEELTELEDEWYTYIQENLTIETSLGLEKAARLAQTQNRDLRAKRLFSEAVAAENPRPVAFYRYANLLEDLDEDELAQENWAKAIEMDSLVPEYYIALGRSLLQSDEDGASVEGERLLRIALEIEPDNAYLGRNLESLVRAAKRKQKKETEGTE